MIETSDTTLGELDPRTVTPLKVLVDGQICATTIGIAIAMGVHPGDLTKEIAFPLNVPAKLAVAAAERFKEAADHIGNDDMDGAVAYWVAKDLQAAVYEDGLGQMWINKPRSELWP